MNITELDQYNLSDAVKFNQTLNPRLWDDREQMRPEVREALLRIAEDFREFLGVDDLQLKDITVSGSNAAYTYTPGSDIDLHLVVDMPEQNADVYQELFNAKKFQYNNEHDIKIGNADVELYVQPSGQPHHSQGIFSIKNNQWQSVPQRRKIAIDDQCVIHKTEDLQQRIDSAIESGSQETMQRLWDKIKNMRQTGLESAGEFGCDNLVFKMLRKSGHIEQLKQAKLSAHDQALSLDERRRKKSKVKYGWGSFGGYWYPGTAYAGQDQPAGSEGSESVKESVDTESAPRLRVSLEQIVSEFVAAIQQELGIQKLPTIKLRRDPEWTRRNGSFGRYDPDANVLYVATAGRHVLDVLRTLAHELTHRRQDELENIPDWGGETGSRFEDEANAMAGRIMRHLADRHPEYFADIELVEGASGYIPKNKKEARMPQYAMALSVDIKPGQTGTEANKLGLKTGPNGEPGLLMKSTNLLKEYQESKQPRRNNPDLNDPPGPETPPTMPAGTVRVDVSDMYDWYKLGQHISNMKGLGRHDFGKGPPSSIFSFGSEELEHKYIDALKKTGLTTTDIDPVDPKQPAGMPRQKTDPTYNVAESNGQSQYVTRIDSQPIKDFASNLRSYKHTPDWSQSGLETDDDSYWQAKKINPMTTKGLFAGDPRRTALYATGNAHETRYVEFTQNGQPIVYFDKKDLPKIRQRQAWLSVFDAANFRKLPTGEWFSDNPGQPIKQQQIKDPFQYIRDQGWVIRVTDNLEKTFDQVKKLHQQGKIAQYGAEGMSESLAEADAARTAKSAIDQTEVFGVRGYRARYLEPGCEWHSRSYDRIQQAQAAAKKHAASHIKPGVAEGFDKNTVNDLLQRIRSGKTIVNLSTEDQQTLLSVIEDAKQKLVGMLNSDAKLRADWPQVKQYIDKYQSQILMTSWDAWFGSGTVKQDPQQNKIYLDNDRLVVYPAMYNFLQWRFLITFLTNRINKNSFMKSDVDVLLKLKSLLGINQTVSEQGVAEQDELIESLRQEFALLEDEFIGEIKMSPSNLRTEAAKTGAIAGMEFEMIVPATESDDEMEPDYDSDESCRSIDDAVEFFQDGGGDVDLLRKSMQDDFGEWLMEKVDEDWANNPEEYIYQYLVADVDPATIGEIIGEDLSDADGATKQQVARAAEIVNDGEQQPYYDDARDWHRTEYNDSWDESDWLDSQDLERMSAIESAYGITWPHWQYNSRSEVDIEQVADEFSTMIGRPVNTSDRYAGGRREAGKYVIEPDGSLRPNNANDRGLEFVSPPLPIDELLSDLNKIKKWADRTGCYTGKKNQTGLHINVSVPEFSNDRLDYVKLALLLGDQYVLDQFGRSSEYYAKSALGIVRNQVRNNPQAAQALLNKMKGHMEDLATKAIHSGQTDKMVSIHPKEGYIEFRSPGGDWLDENFDKIENTLLRFTVALKAAMDPEAYREEYLDRLYKLLTGQSYGRDPQTGDLEWQVTSKKETPYQDTRTLKSGQTVSTTKRKPEFETTVTASSAQQAWNQVKSQLSPDAQASDFTVKRAMTDSGDKDLLKFFAQYSAGKLPETALRSFVKQAQLQRRIAKEPASGKKYWWRVYKDGQNARNTAMVEVVASSEQEAIDKAAAEFGVFSSEYKAYMDAVALRPYVETEPEAATQPAAPQQTYYINNGSYNTSSILASSTEDAIRQFRNRVRNERMSSSYSLVSSDNQVLARGTDTEPSSQGGEFQFERPQTDIENRLGWPDQTADANYEVVNRNTLQPVYLFIANTDQDAARKYSQIIQAMGMPGAAENYGYRARGSRMAPVAGQGSQSSNQRPAAGGNFTGVWLILDPDGDVIHSFAGVGNVQSDANRVAMQWLRANPGAMQDGVTVVPEMR